MGRTSSRNEEHKQSSPTGRLAGRTDRLTMLCDASQQGSRGLRNDPLEKLPPPPPSLSSSSSDVDGRRGVRCQPEGQRNSVDKGLDDPTAARPLTVAGSLARSVSQSVGRAAGRCLSPTRRDGTGRHQ